MLTLTCDTVESTYASLAPILQLPRSDLEQWVVGLLPDDLGDGASVVWDAFCADRKRTILPEWNATVFFHATRSLDPQMYLRDGLWPLDTPLIDRIWAQMGMLAQPEVSHDEWMAFRRTVEGDAESAYAYKTTPNGSERGPLGWLIRELVFQLDELRHHDYLDIPEIIEDIALQWAGWNQSHRGIDLVERFRQQAAPCIVAFRAKRTRESYLEAALTYLYWRTHGGGWLMATTVAYDGQGVAVPPDHIEAVECPPDSSRR